MKYAERCLRELLAALEIQNISKLMKSDNPENFAKLGTVMRERTIILKKKADTYDALQLRNFKRRMNDE